MRISTLLKNYKLDAENNQTFLQNDNYLALIQFVKKSIMRNNKIQRAVKYFRNNNPNKCMIPKGDLSESII